MPVSYFNSSSGEHHHELAFEDKGMKSENKQLHAETMGHSRIKGVSNPKPHQGPQEENILVWKLMPVLH